IGELEVRRNGALPALSPPYLNLSQPAAPISGILTREQSQDAGLVPDSQAVLYDDSDAKINPSPGVQGAHVPPAVASKPVAREQARIDRYTVRMRKSRVRGSRRTALGGLVVLLACLTATMIVGGAWLLHDWESGQERDRRIRERFEEIQRMRPRSMGGRGPKARLSCASERLRLAARPPGRP